MKNSLVILLFSSLYMFAQTDSTNLNQDVNGIVTTSEGAYLILEQGVIHVNKTNIYTEYYRKIYNDSTIINPNLELKADFNFNILPYLYPAFDQNIIELEQPLKLGIFLQLKGADQFYLTPFAEEFVDSISNSD